MTKNEFQEKYHDYRVFDGDEAKAEAEKVNKQLTDGSRVKAVEFPPFGWCLMLDTAYKTIVEIGVIEE